MITPLCLLHESLIMQACSTAVPQSIHYEPDDFGSLSQPLNQQNKQLSNINISINCTAVHAFKQITVPWSDSDRKIILIEWHYSSVCDLFYWSET